MKIFDIGRCHLLVKCRITCLRETLRQLRFFFESLSITLVNGQHDIFSVACTGNSDSEMLAALQTVDSVVRTQTPCRDERSFRCFWLVGRGKDFVASGIPSGLSSGLSPRFHTKSGCGKEMRILIGPW